MNRLLATLVILCLASIFVLTTGTAQTDPTEVRATQENRFEPQEITITAGTTVRWVNDGPYHTVTSTDSNELGEQEPNGMFDEELAAEGDTFEFTFDEPGTYEYYCKPHAAVGMVGTVTVTEASGDGNGTGNDDEMNGGGNGGADTEGSPAPGFAFLLAGVAALVLLYRRR